MSGRNLIAEANQLSASIDRKGHGDQEFPFWSRKSGNILSVDFGRNADDKIRMTPLRPIGRPHPNINRTRISNYYILELVIRDLPWHGRMKIKTENLVENIRGNKSFKNDERGNISEVEKVEHKNSVNWNHTELILDKNKNSLTQSTLIQITMTRFNPFQTIQQTSYQSIIQKILMQYKIYWNYRYILYYLLHQYFHMGVQVTLCHNHMTHQKKSRHLKELLINVTSHPIWNSTYRMTRIHPQVCQILIRQSHLSHHRTGIIN